MAVLIDILGTLGGVDAGSQAAASRLIEVGRAVGPKKDEQEPVEALLKIGLDNELAEIFRSPLKELGFELSERPLPVNPFDPTDDSERTVSIAARRGLDFFLICVPYWLLSDARPTHLAAFALLGYSFPKNSIVYIISRDLSDMDLGFEGMLKSWRVEKSVKAEFIRWSRISKLKKTRDVKVHATLVREFFGISEIEKYMDIHTNTTPTEVPERDREDIIRVLASRANDPFADPKQYFKDFVEKAGLRELNQFVWQGMPDTDARRLVTWAAETLKVYPRGNTRVGQTTLGWLIVSLIEEKLSPDDAQILANIALTHALIRDETKIQTLQLIALPSEPLQ